MVHTLEQLDRVLKIPTLPSVFARICSMLNDPEVGMREIGAALAEDAPITATVLRIANSASYGLVRTIASSEEAATILGALALRNLTLQAAILHEYEHLERMSSFDIKQIWRHSQMTARVAKKLTQKSMAASRPNADESYTCGLLHDLGKVVLLDTLRVDYIKVLEEAEQAQVATHVVEKEKLGFTHMDVGRRVTERWNLPELITVSAGDHHNWQMGKSACLDASLLAIADEISNQVQSGIVPEPDQITTESVREQCEVSPSALADVITFAIEIWPTIEV